MRPAVLAFVLAFVALGCEQLAQSLGTGTQTTAGSDIGSSDASAEASVIGGGCGTESNTNAQLCIATTMCPDVVVDTQATPHCGFRIRGAAVDLVCGCGSAICPMGIFSSCEEAQTLLDTQTEQDVCAQISAGRCTETGASTTPTDPTPSTCDRACLKDCGGGAACAAVCNC